MNITISYLAAYSLFSSSPAFARNNFSFINSNFQKFSSLLFYNQISLSLKRTLFTHGLNGIIYNDVETITEKNHITITKENFIKPYKPEKTSISITIMDCIFDNIQVTSNDPSLGKYIIRIDEQDISLYITHSYFNNFVSTEGAIRLDKTRCSTITHVCATNIKTGNRVPFLYYNCVPDDFSILLYSTLVDTGRDDNANDANTIYCINGDQYYRCNNITKCHSTAYHFVAPICFSFAMNTVIECDCSCIEISGYNRDSCPKLNKYIKNVNFFSKGFATRPVLYFDLNCNFDIYIENSVLLSQTNNLFNQGSRAVSHFTATNCIICNYGYADDTNIKFENCQTVSYDYMHLTVFPHYTYGEACEGPVLKDTSAALGCNAGNCIDSECDKTISFPDGVIQYTTIIYTDINTPTLSPIVTFSKSSAFSESFKFSESQKFSKSSGFSDSDELYKPLKISPSKQFSHSSIFSDSATIINSFLFTQSSFNDRGNGENQGGDEKGTNKAMIGGIIAAVVVVVIAIIVVTVIMIKKRKNYVTSDAEMIETDNSAVTTNNKLHSVMKEDDPFASEFIDD